MSLRATYFDGRSAVKHEVRLLPLPGAVWVQGEGWDRRASLETVKIGERLGRAPRVIRFDDGATCEVPDGPVFEEWLATLGYRDRAVDRAQRSWTLAIASIVVVLAAGFVGYRWGLPWAAEHLAQRVPDAATIALSDQTLELLDDHMLKASALDAARQKALTTAFERIDPAHHGTLLFRSAPAIGANAMALPDGRIVLLDELVAVAKHEDEILAVLAHELGHVERRHGLRLMIQGAVVAAFVAWWIGDFSPLIAGAPAAILQARHSRQLESEADADAARKLHQLGIAPSRLADMLERIAAAHGQHDAQEPSGWQDYLSSHPATRERIAALRGS